MIDSSLYIYDFHKIPLILTIADHIVIQSKTMRNAIYKLYYQDELCLTIVCRNSKVRFTHRRLGLSSEHFLMGCMFRSRIEEGLSG